MQDTDAQATDAQAGAAPGGGDASPRVLVLCDGAALRASLAHAFGPGYAAVDPHALAHAIAAPRGWDVTRVRVYASADAAGDTDGLQDWQKQVATTRAQLVSQAGDIRFRLALDGVAALRDRQADILLVMGGDAALMALAHDTRSIARRQNRDIKFASAFAPSSHPCGRTVPSADFAVTIDRDMVEHALLLASGAPRPRRIYAGRPTLETPPAGATAAPVRRLRPLRALYGMGFAASTLALVWEDVVAAGGMAALADWDKWRWGVSAMLALAKSLVWPLYWLARALGIPAG